MVESTSILQDHAEWRRQDVQLNKALKKWHQAMQTDKEDLARKEVDIIQHQWHEATNVFWEKHGVSPQDEVGIRQRVESMKREEGQGGELVFSRAMDREQMMTLLGVVVLSALTIVFLN